MRKFSLCLACLTLSVAVPVLAGYLDWPVGSVDGADLYSGKTMSSGPDNGDGLNLADNVRGIVNRFWKEAQEEGVTTPISFEAVKLWHGNGFANIPEPTGLSLLAFGLAALLVRRRKGGIES